MHPVYTFDKSMETLRRAMEVIPAGIYGHLGPAEGCHIPIALDDHTLRVGTATVTFDPALCDYALHSEPLTSTGKPCYMMDFTLKTGVEKVAFVIR